MDPRRISPHDLQTRRVLDGATLIDVRGQDEFRAGHVPGAVNLPLDQLSPEALARTSGDARLGQGKPVYLACLTGFRAAQAAERLSQAGVPNVVLLDGGTRAWESAGLPVRRCGSAISLARQVQITIGVLIVAKVLLGFTVHELFFAAAALVGASLMVAGIRNACGLNELLARMPWNRHDQCRERVAQAA
ncbi:MAG: rhodanese-like domain-containing protein [Chromatiales bacterium]|nr:rhodanese-like domain-containing protein [Gammaproteobacteria bacterium]MCP5352650.1 rhodanese-like domain-containing protein [Chromatiales bacterium]